MSRIFFQVANKIVGLREILFAVIFKEHLIAVAKQRVPIPTKINLAFIVAGEDFVNGDKHAVRRKGFEEITRARPLFEKEIIMPRLLLVVAKLPPRRTSADD